MLLAYIFFERIVWQNFNVDIQYEFPDQNSKAKAYHKMNFMYITNNDNKLNLFTYVINSSPLNQMQPSIRECNERYECTV